jgi:hypothetical protein
MNEHKKKICNREEAAWQEHEHAMKEELSGKVANVYLYHNTRTNTFIYFNSGRIIFKNT